MLDTRTLRIIVLGLWLMLPTITHALDERIAITQAPDGSIVATFLRITQSCGDVYALLTPQVSVVGTNVSIVSPVAVGTCAPGVSIPPTPYSAPVNLGPLNDGVYSVNWSFVWPLFVPPAWPPLTASFSIRNGVLVGPVVVPTLSPVGHLSLMCLVFISAWYFTKRARKREVGVPRPGPKRKSAD